MSKMIETETINQNIGTIEEAESVVEISLRRRAFGKALGELIRESSNPNYGKQILAKKLIRAGGINNSTVGRQTGRMLAVLDPRQDSSKESFIHYLNPLLVSMDIKRKEVF